MWIFLSKCGRFGQKQIFFLKVTFDSFVVLETSHQCCVILGKCCYASTGAPLML